jgi:mRNA-degrading endonuclease toxin of MazEF toxin-antitoxin module
VVVNYPYGHGATAKKRPALVVAAEPGAHEDGNALLAVLRISARVFGRERGERGEIDIEDVSSAGLTRPSHVEARRLFTVQRRNVLKVLGRVSPSELRRAKEALGQFLDL